MCVSLCSLVFSQCVDQKLLFVFRNAKFSVPELPKTEDNKDLSSFVKRRILLDNQTLFPAWKRSLSKWEIMMDFLSWDPFSATRNWESDMTLGKLIWAIGNLLNQKLLAVQTGLTFHESHTYVPQTADFFSWTILKTAIWCFFFDEFVDRQIFTANSACFHLLIRYCLSCLENEHNGTKKPWLVQTKADS